jgi:hypothetical protein
LMMVSFMKVCKNFARLHPEYCVQTRVVQRQGRPLGKDIPTRCDPTTYLNTAAR